jgi:hypothetical protein
VPYTTQYTFQQPYIYQTTYTATRTIGPLAKVKGVFVNDAGTLRKLDEVYVNDSGTARKIHQSVPTAQYSLT